MTCTCNVSLGSSRPAGRYQVPDLEGFASCIIRTSLLSLITIPHTMYPTDFFVMGTKDSVIKKKTTANIHNVNVLLYILKKSLPFIYQRSIGTQHLLSLPITYILNTVPNFKKIGPCGPELIWPLANQIKGSIWITYKINVTQISNKSSYPVSYEAHTAVN